MKNLLGEDIEVVDNQFKINFTNNILIDYYEKSGVTEVKIPENITIICGYAFYCCTDLISIIIPEGVRRIGEYAFFNCQGLKEINLPNNILIISDSVFKNCKSLTSITIPSSVWKIEFHAFCGCSNLNSITIPNSVIEIEQTAFSGCNNLTDINIYSYRVFSLLDEKLKHIALISTIKNYYTGKIKYSDEDMNHFKEYIRKNKIEIFEQQKNNKEIIKILLCDMGNFLTTNDIDELLSQNIEPEINSMLLEYSNKIRNEETNPLVDLDLGEFEDNLGIAK